MNSYDGLTPPESNEKSIGNGESEKKSKYPSPENPSKRHILPTYHHEGRLVTKGIQPDGESGRSGFHPFHFFRVAWRSATPWNKWLNLLWPFVPAAIVLHFGYKEYHRAIFAVSYIAMVPAASLLGFAGQELARKLPRVIGILLETILTGVVEIVLFSVLIVQSEGGNLVPVIKAAILGSILANLLLCLGACFVIGGVKWKEQTFHPIISENGSGLLLVAGFGLLIPTAFYSALSSRINPTDPRYNLETLNLNVGKISWATSIILMVSFFLYLVYSVFSHDSLFDEVLRQDEENDNDRERDLARSKFTLTEAVLAICLSLTFISLLAVFLVFEIEYLVDEYHVPDNFLGLILVPLVEKIAEHITAVDEAYDNQINFALFHCLFPSIQTALFNAPLVVLIGWGLDNSAAPGTALKGMDLNFEVFMIVVLILAIIVVGNFLRDGSSNYLEGSLLLAIYLIIAVTAWYFPNPADLAVGTGGENSGGGEEQIATDLIRRAVQGISAL